MQIRWDSETEELIISNDQNEIIGYVYEYDNEFYYLSPWRVCMDVFLTLADAMNSLVTTSPMLRNNGE